MVERCPDSLHTLIVELLGPSPASHLYTLGNFPPPLLKGMHITCRLCSAMEERGKHRHTNSDFSLPYVHSSLVSLRHNAHPTLSILILPFLERQKKSQDLHQQIIVFPTPCSLEYINIGTYGAMK